MQTMYVFISRRSNKPAPRPVETIGETSLSPPTSQPLAVAARRHDEFAQVITSLDIFSALIAAAAHDVGHTGTTNEYHCKVQTSLARAYNDVSVLENMHAATTFEIAHAPDCDVFAGLSAHDKQEARETIVCTARRGHCTSNHFALFVTLPAPLKFSQSICDSPTFRQIHLILATDLKNHIGMLKDVHEAIDRKRAAGTWFLHSSRVDRLQLLEMAMHAADVSNPAKPMKLCVEWANRIVEEWHHQGDLEVEHSVSVSPMCDRNKTQLEKSQIGFIDFFVRPLYEVWVETSPSLAFTLKQLTENRAAWTERLTTLQTTQKPRTSSTTTASVPQTRQESSKQKRMIANAPAPASKAHINDKEKKDVAAMISPRSSPQRAPVQAAASDVPSPLKLATDDGDHAAATLLAALPPQETDSSVTTPPETAVEAATPQ
jgi:hypothetical protein